MPEPIHPDRDELDHGALSRTPQQDWEFAGARELRDWVQSLTEQLHESAEWQMTPGSFENLFIGTFARGTKTYRAALLLCDRGYGEQAAMLNRSLFEHMVVAWWMLLQPDGDELVAKMQRHHDHARVLYERASEQHPELELEPGKDAEPLDEEYIAALDKEFGPHSGQWHGKRLDQLVREVEGGWAEPYSGVLWKFFRFVNHWNNYILHHSAVGVSEGVRWHDPEETPTLLLGPTRDWRDVSLWAAFWCYALLLLAVLRQLSPARVDDYRAFFEPRAYRFITVTREMARNVGRNDPCLCGSERKFKVCHEPYVTD
jgi:hypothetical protein